MKTTEFTLCEREELSRLLAQGHTLFDVAKLLRKDRITISREVARKDMNRSHSLRDRSNNCVWSS